MSQFSEKHLRVFSLVISVCAHAALLVFGYTAVAYSSVITPQFDQSILVELNSFASAAHLPQKVKVPSDPIQKSTSRVKPAEKSAQAAPKNPGWNDREFNERQGRMDAKIETIRDQIKKMREARSEEFRGQLKGFELVSAGLESESWKAYLAKLRKQVLDQWYPLILSHEDELDVSEVRLDFFIGTNGQILEYKIAESSGSEKFSELCLEAFKRAIAHGLNGEKRATGQESGSLKISLFFYYQ